ncbi:ZIP family metal transporter [Cohnella laeviribosi]|uniref:ZIP family metal transporter n=1 Tax=Cohnella laeviribosi TaxID=380174 RepID=UPI00035C8601|nr:ZIP family metal transporter [Cohnella laeviribosi]
MNWSSFLFVLLAACANVVGHRLMFVFKQNWSRRGLYALMAMSAGLLMAIAILDFIPDSLEHESSSPVFVLLGMLSVYFFQQYVAGHFHFGEETHVHDHVKSTTVGAMVGMLIHTFFDGLSIAASFDVDFGLGITVFIAVLLHKIPDGLTISSIIFTLLQDQKKAIGAALLLGVSTLAGAVTAFVLSDFYLPGEQTAAVAIAFSSGIFLYVAATDLLPVVNAAGDRRAALFLFAGILLYFALQWGSNWLAPL